MLVSKEPSHLEIPYEQDEWIDVLTLSWKQLRAARKKQEQEQRGVMKELGPAFIKALTSSEDGEKKAEKFLRDRQYDESNFDTESLLQSSIISWSYKNNEDEIVPVSPENIEMLDERTAVWVKQEIINLTKPLDEDEVKNS